MSASSKEAFGQAIEKLSYMDRTHPLPLGSPFVITPFLARTHGMVSSIIVLVPFTFCTASGSFGEFYLSKQLRDRVVCRASFSDRNIGNVNMLCRSFPWCPPSSPLCILFPSKRARDSTLPTS